MRCKTLLTTDKYNGFIYYTYLFKSQNYTQQYNYDELGNINQMKSVCNWTRNYFYNTADNKLLGHTQNTTEYTYDAHGNMLTMPHLSAMAWDFQNRLFSATNGTFTSYYNYDATGYRASSDLIPNPSPTRRRER